MGEGLLDALSCIHLQTIEKNPGPDRYERRLLDKQINCPHLMKQDLASARLNGNLASVPRANATVKTRSRGGRKVVCPFCNRKLLHPEKSKQNVWSGIHKMPIDVEEKLLKAELDGRVQDAILLRAHIEVEDCVPPPTATSPFPVQGDIELDPPVQEEDSKSCLADVESVSADADMCGEVEAPSPPPFKTVIVEAPKRNLKGHEFSPEVHMKMAASALNLPYDWVECLGEWGLFQMEVHTGFVPFDGDNRIISNRNVKVIAQGYDVTEVNFRAPLGVKRLKAWVIRSVTMAVLAFVFLTLNFIPFLKSFGVLQPLSCVSMAAMLASGLMSIKMIHSDVHRGKVLYAPHIATCVLVEYPRHTSPVVIASTVSMKMNRLAAFPVEDSLHLAIKDGTELCILAALEEKYFQPGLAVSSIRHL